MRNIRFSTRTGITIVLIAIAVVTLTSAWTMARQSNPDLRKPGDSEAYFAKAYLDVSNMSCGGCEANIAKSLASIPGIGGISVDVAAGKAEVLFNPEVLTNQEMIAQAVTKAGYPAKLTRIESAQAVHQQIALDAERAKTLIASVGQIGIARKDFETEWRHARSRYEQIYGKDVFASEKGQKMRKQIKAQIAQRMVDEGIKLQEVDRARYTLPKQTIDDAFNAYLLDKGTTLQQLKADMKANDYPYTYFRKKFTDRIRLQKYLESEVLDNGLDDDTRQQMYRNWLANARSLAQVTYYDKALKKIVEASGKSSCGGNAGSCAASR